MNEFKRIKLGEVEAGTRVIYVSGKHADSVANPLWNSGMYGKVIGTIDAFRKSGLPIHVKWDNGRTNSYNYRDLALVPADPVTTLLGDEIFEI